MSSIDTKGMTLAYKVRGSTSNEKQSVRISFQPPLSGYNEVKPRLLSMTADAYEALGMAKTPQITTFELPFGIYQTTILLGFLIYTSISPSFVGSFWKAGQWLFNGIGGSRTIRVIWFMTTAIHLGEAIYVQRLCIKHRTSFDVALKYVSSSFLFGFPVLIPLLRKIQQARIDSIMKSD